MADFEEFTIPLDETSIAGYVALTGETVNEQDAYHLPKGSPYTISRAFDEKSGYRTKSMLVVPMKDHQDVVIGVVQLINKKRDPEAVLQSASLVDDQVISFTSVDRNLVESLASQAAVAFENADLIQRIRKLFDDFVHAAVAAVELRDPTTSGHSERVATSPCGLAERVDAVSSGPFADVRASPATSSRSCATPPCCTTSARSRSRRRSCGKGKKLYASQMIAIRQRFAYILKASRPSTCGRGSSALESGRAGAERARGDRRRVRSGGAPRRSACCRRCCSANEPTVVEEESFRALMNLPARRFASHEAEERLPGGGLGPGALPERGGDRGALDPQGQPLRRRSGRRSRATSRTPTSSCRRSRGRASCGASPRSPGPTTRSSTARATRAASRRRTIPVQSRMMTIADIYDALVAWDRPYKKAVSVESGARDPAATRRGTASWTRTC